MFKRLTWFMTAAFVAVPLTSFAEVPCARQLDGAPRVLPTELDEISGLARGRVNDVFWAHTDSGGKSEVYALDQNGQLLRTVQIKGVKNVDWEDIASGPCDAKDLASACLYISDMGDNRFRRTDKKILVVRETKLPEDATKPVSFDVVRTIPIVFSHTNDVTEPKFANPDCESLMVDPRDASIYFVSKQSTGGAQTLYRVDTTVKKKKLVVTLTPLAQATFKSMMGNFQPLFNAVTSADFSPDGTRFLVRTYAKIYEYDVSQNSIAQAFEQPTREFVAGDIQGESVAYLFDGQGIVTASEKVKDVAPNPTMRVFSCQ